MRARCLLRGATVLFLLHFAMSVGCERAAESNAASPPEPRADVQPDSDTDARPGSDSMPDSDTGSQTGEITESARADQPTLTANRSKTERTPAADAREDSPDPQPDLEDSAEPMAASTSPTTGPDGTAPRDRLERNRIIIDSINDDILDPWFKHGTISAELASVFEPLNTRNMLTEDRQQGEGTRDSIILPDGREKVHSVLGSIILFQKMADDAPDDDTFYMTGSRTEKFSDGYYVYTYEKNKLGAAVRKDRAIWPHIDYIGGPGLIQLLFRLDMLVHLPDESLDGSDCFVLRGTSSDRNTVYKFWIDKTTGIRLRMEIRNRIDRTRYEVKLTNVKTGVEFPEDHFSPDLPEGVEIQDMTVPGAVYRQPGSEQTAPKP